MTAAFGAEGFSAAAAFAAVYRGRSPEAPPYETTRAMACFDRPFGFLTVHRESGPVLAAGRVGDPAPFAADEGGHVSDVPVVADPAWFIPLAIVAGLLLLSQGVKSISKHAAQRGISQEMVARTVKTGKKTKGKSPGTWKYTTGKIWIVIDKAGTVVSVGRS